MKVTTLLAQATLNFWRVQSCMNNPEGTKPLPAEEAISLLSIADKMRPEHHKIVRKLSLLSEDVITGKRRSKK